MNIEPMRSISEKTCGYSLAMCFFMIMLSTFLANFFIIIAVIISFYLMLRNNDIYNIFIRNSTNLYIFILIIFFCFSFLYTNSNLQESFDVFKKYIKLLYIPLCFYIYQIEWVRKKSIDFFICGSTLALIASYLKFFNILDPIIIYNIFSLETYNEKLSSGVQVFQSSITHGIVFSFFSYITFFKANKNNHYLYYILSFFSFYNVLFMNDSRSGYIIIIFLLLYIIFQKIKYNQGKKIYLIPLIIFSVLFFSNKNIIENKINQTIDNYELIRTNDYDTSIGLRYIWWKNGIENILNKPFFGYGVGGYKVSIINYAKKNNIDIKNLISNNPHNEFISISTQLGIAGLSLFFLLLYTFYKNSLNKNLSFAVLIIVVISCFFNSAFYNNIVGIFFVLMISYSLNKNKYSGN